VLLKQYEMDAGDLTHCSGKFCYALAVINIIFAVLTIPENITVLIALSRLAKAKTWKVPNVLMASLAITDLLSGSVSQSLYGYFLLKQGSEFDRNDIRGADFALLLLLNYSSYTLCGASLLIVAIMSIDRLLAILRPIAYKANAYRTRIISAVVIAWLFCLLIPILRFVSRETVSPFVYIISGVMVLALVATFISYIVVIYLFFNLGRQGSLSVSGGRTSFIQQESNPTQMTVSMQESTTSCKEKRLTKSFAIIAITLVMMYLPQLIIKPLILNTSSSLHSFPVPLEDLANTLLYCNSFANPLIYAYRHNGIRSELKAMFKQLLSRNPDTTSSTYQEAKRASSDTYSSTGSANSQGTCKSGLISKQPVDTKL